MYNPDDDDDDDDNNVASAAADDDFESLKERVQSIRSMMKNAKARGKKFC